MAFSGSSPIEEAFSHNSGRSFDCLLNANTFVFAFITARKSKALCLIYPPHKSIIGISFDSDLTIVLHQKNKQELRKDAKKKSTQRKRVMRGENPKKKRSISKGKLSFRGKRADLNWIMRCSPWSHEQKRCLHNASQSA